MAKGAPYFPFYVDAWLDDESIFDMGLECEGAYVRILAAMWKRGGSIQDKPALICNLLRIKPAKWRKIRTVLVDETGVICAQNGQLLNEKLTKERQLFEKKSKKNAENASGLRSKNDETASTSTNENNETGGANAERTLSDRRAIQDIEGEVDTEGDNSLSHSAESGSEKELGDQPLSKHFASEDFRSAWDAWVGKQEAANFRRMDPFTQESQLLELNAFETEEAIAMVRFSTGRTNCNNLIIDGSHKPKPKKSVGSAGGRGILEGASEYD